MRTIKAQLLLPAVIMFIAALFLSGCESISTEPERMSIEGTWYAEQSDYQLTMDILEEGNTTHNYRVIGEGEVINQYGTIVFIVRGDADERIVGAGEAKVKDLHLTATLSNGVEFLMDLKYSYNESDKITGILTVVDSNHREMITLTQVAGN